MSSACAPGVVSSAARTSFDSSFSYFVSPFVIMKTISQIADVDLQKCAGGNRP